MSLYFFPSVLSSVVFTTYFSLGYNISLASAFQVLIFFDYIKGLIRNWPLFISSTLQALVSMKRIQDFINSDEVDTKMLVNDTTGSCKDSEVVISI